MKHRALTLGLGFVACSLLTGLTYAEPIQGRIGASSTWGAGWVDLDHPVNFKRGDKIMLKIGGTAEKVIIRFLEKGKSPDDPVGIDSGALPVPTDRTVSIILKNDHPQTEQISVHGGEDPWGLYPLGEHNGPATLLSAERVGR
ncbi:MAG: hypothetical protein ABSD31_20025 [Candidatus Binataceae bacterium]|jgi:hypothetical protein